MLTLVSRVQEKRGDIRFMLRQDPTVQREVHSYLDDLMWLSQRVPLQPNTTHVAAAKSVMLATVTGQVRHRKFSPLRIAGGVVSVTVLFGLIASTQAATHNLPQPVNEMLTGLLFAKQGAESDLPSSHQLVIEPSVGVPADKVLVEATSTGFSN